MVRAAALLEPLQTPKQQLTYRRSTDTLAGPVPQATLLSQWQKHVSSRTATTASQRQQQQQQSQEEQDYSIAAVAVVVAALASELQQQ